MKQKQQRGRKQSLEDEDIVWLRKYYSNDCRTSTEIADELGCNPRTVQYYAQKYHLKKTSAARSVIASQNVMQRYV